MGLSVRNLPCSELFVAVCFVCLFVFVFCIFCFFFQAEDGIRDVAVTGVQTCALPIYILGAFKP